MANLKNTTITTLTVSNNITCNSTTSVSNNAYLSSRPNISSSYTTTGVINFTNTVDLLKDFDKVNGRFTALEEGLYTIMFANISSASGIATTNRTYIRVNGSRISQARGEGGVQYPMVNAMHTAYLVAGDYVDLEHTAGQVYLTTTYTAFNIHRSF